MLFSIHVALMFISPSVQVNKLAFFFSLWVNEISIYCQVILHFLFLSSHQSFPRSCMFVCFFICFLVAVQKLCFPSTSRSGALIFKARSSEVKGGRLNYDARGFILSKSVRVLVSYVLIHSLHCSLSSRARVSF